MFAFILFMCANIVVCIYAMYSSKVNYSFCIKNTKSNKLVKLPMVALIIGAIIVIAEFIILEVELQLMIGLIVLALGIISFLIWKYIFKHYKIVKYKIRGLYNPLH